MKKAARLFSILLFISCLVFQVSAQEESHPHSADHCVCGGCAVGVEDHACKEISWQPLPANTTNFSTLPSGNYYLTGNVTVTATGTWKDAKQLNLCLNGYDINTTAGSVFYYLDAGVVLNICDCSGVQDAAGNWSWGGTITANRTGKSSVYGGVFNLRANALANIYGGNFVGATAPSKNGSIFNVCHDGYAFAGGSSNTDTSLYTLLSIYNGHFTGGMASSTGGIINSWHNADVSIFGGIFTGGSATRGGCLNFSTGDYILKNCTITNGTATDKCGNVYAEGAHSILIENCTISGGTAGTECGNLSVQSSVVVDLTSNTITGGSPESARVVKDGKYLVKDYLSLQDAFNKAKDSKNQYVQLLCDQESTATVSGTVFLDLAGHDLSGITIDGTLYGMDSTTDGYDGTHAGTLTPVAGAPQTLFKSSETLIGAVRRYLCTQENGSFGFHRYYVGVTSAVLAPTRSGFGFKATFAGDEQVRNALSSSGGFGFAVSLETLPESLDGNVYRALASRYFTPGAPFSKQLVVSNILSPSANDNSARSRTEVYARAYIRLADGTVIFSDEHHRNMRQLVETVNSNWSTYSDPQKAAVDGMLKAHELYTSGWNVANIHHHDTELWQPWTGSWKSGGHYYLTEDISLGRLTIAEGQTLDICLNGHDIIGNTTSTRMFNVKGVFNLHDHCDENGIYGGEVITSCEKPNMGPIFYVYERAVFNLCGGHLHPAETAISHRGGVGMIGNGNDNKDYATMNMWNGTISGGRVTAVWDSTENNFSPTAYSGTGGNIDMVSYAVLNIYDGTIAGGTATYDTTDGSAPIPKSNANGGNISMGNVSILNMYGGSITGGMATTQNQYGGQGGNIYNVGGKLNLYSGLISDGTSDGARGGNIFSTGPLAIENATVTGGTALALTLNGESDPSTGIGSGIYTTKNISISGNPHILDNTGDDLYLAEKATLDAQNLSESARIGVTAELHCRLSKDPYLADRFVSNDSAYRIAVINGCTALVPVTLDTGLVDAEKNTFSVGYSMTDITPTEEGLIMSGYGNPNGRLSSGLNYRLYATTVAITDREDNTFLMITVDLQNSPVELFSEAFTRISEITGVPAENIYVSATHTHNVPTLTTSSVKNKRYLYQFMDALIHGAVTALEDRSPATMQTGSFDTEGMNFSRHYYYYDENGNYTDENGKRISYFGDQFGIKPSGVEVFRVREGDATMHLLAFQRQDKESILLANWRAHPHRSGGKEKYTIDADVIGAVREYIHANTDYRFAYFQGAAGNMNTTSRISGETYKSGKITEYGNELGRQIKENGLPQLRATPTGLIHTDKVIYSATVDHSEDSRYEDAVALQSYYTNNPELMDTYEEQIAKAAEMGFSSVFHASRLIAKYKLGATKDLELNIFSIGDSVGFYTAPGELWDSVSEEMEQRSPFGTTFCVGYSNGNVAYIPYQVNYSSYEYHYCLFTQDATILNMMNIYETKLREQYNK